LNKSKKPNSLVPGDLPVKLIREFRPELAKPIARIYNKITHSAEYPRQWVVEYQLAIPKVYPPLRMKMTPGILQAQPTSASNTNLSSATGYFLSLNLSLTLASVED
jgi:hypothetical protein